MLPCVVTPSAIIGRLSGGNDGTTEGADLRLIVVDVPTNIAIDVHVTVDVCVP